MSRMSDLDLMLQEMPLFRAADPSTSAAGAGAIRLRRGTQAAQLLAVYAANLNGLTNEEAGTLSGLAAKPGCGYWKRCSDLLNAGLIEDTGIVREASTGSYQRVLAVTNKGLEAYGKLRMDAARA